MIESIIEFDPLTGSKTNDLNLIKLYANSGAAQILFFEGEEPEISYAEGKRKYQGQVGITLAKSK